MRVYYCGWAEWTPAHVTDRAHRARRVRPEGMPSAQTSSAGGSGPAPPPASAVRARRCTLAARLAGV